MEVLKFTFFTFFLLFLLVFLLLLIFTVVFEIVGLQVEMSLCDVENNSIHLVNDLPDVNKMQHANFFNGTI